MRASEAGPSSGPRLSLRPADSRAVLADVPRSGMGRIYSLHCLAREGRAEEEGRKEGLPMPPKEKKKKEEEKNGAEKIGKENRYTSLLSPRRKGRGRTKEGLPIPTKEKRKKEKRSRKNRKRKQIYLYFERIGSVADSLTFN